MFVSFRRRRHLLLRGVIVLAVGWLCIFKMSSLLSETPTGGKHPVPPEQLSLREERQQDDEQRPRVEPRNIVVNNIPPLQPQAQKAPQPVVESKNEKIESHEQPAEPQKPADQIVVAVPHQQGGGYGEMGAAVILNLSSAEDAIRQKKFKQHYLDEYVSDLVSLHRSLPDVRNPGCKEVRYPIEKMPKVSVIVCFHNEAFTILMRTVHSILDRSPPQLLMEVILVDDFSDTSDMGKRLEDYVATLPKVKLLRCKKREGLIRGRLLGAQSARAPVLVFLDSHCECTQGWLEPISYRIHENETNVVVPVIDVIDDKTLKYNGDRDANIQVGGFDWGLMFNWHVPPSYEIRRRQNSWDPIRTPTMAGGLFAISKNFFEHLGTYDAAMDFWGGENMELSFKTWLCGGTLETLPCSHVGHIFRSNSPHKWPGENAVRKNTLRVALVWMDEYAKYFIDRIGEENVRPEIYGDISQRIDLRKRLNCKKFDYFVKNVWPEIFLPSDSIATGEIRNMAAGNKSCLDMVSDHNGQPVKIFGCHGQRGNQYWLYTKDGEIRHDDSCLDYLAAEGQHVVMRPCHRSFGNQAWSFNPVEGLIYHNVSRLCLEMHSDSQTVDMKTCDKTNLFQRWTFSKFNMTAFEHYRTTVRD